MLMVAFKRVVNAACRFWKDVPAEGTEPGEEPAPGTKPKNGAKKKSSGKAKS
jgi:hypothetical protein